MAQRTDHRTCPVPTVPWTMTVRQLTADNDPTQLTVGSQKDVSDCGARRAVILGAEDEK